MSVVFYSLTYLFLINLFIHPIACDTQNKIQNVEYNATKSLWDEFAFVLDRFQDAVNRVRCSKGWKRLGGSCYRLSNSISALTSANDTCDRLNSNLMQIGNAFELFYAAHVLSSNNFTLLMIEIAPNLLEGKKILDISRTDQHHWNEIKEKFRKARHKYQQLVKSIIGRLNSAGLHISRYSRKAKQSLEPYESNQTIMNHSSNVNNTETEYDDLNSIDDGDEFEQIENIHEICYQVHWNALNDNSTVYILSTYIVSNRTICTISDIQFYTKYHYVCEYVLDFCFANALCGKHGYCENTLSGFQCSCTLLYGGLFCEKMTSQGQQIIIGIVIITVFFVIYLSPIQSRLEGCVKLLTDACKKSGKVPKEMDESTVEDEEEEEGSFDQRIQPPKDNLVRRKLYRYIWFGVLSVLTLAFCYILITIRYYTLYEIDGIENATFEAEINRTVGLIRRCETTFDFPFENLIFALVACALTLIFSYPARRRKQCLVPPIEPFLTKNRFATALVFGILAFEVLKTIEQLLFGSRETSKYGVLVEVLIQIGTIMITGIRYYPILISLQLYNIFVRFLACLYIISIIVYTVMREGSCMSHLPIGGRYTVLEEAKLRMDFSLWFIIYGLIKDIPHFVFLSCICAELWLRFLFDSIYVAIRNRRSIFSVPDRETDESEMSEKMVEKTLEELLKRNKINKNPNNDQNQGEQNRKANHPCWKQYLNCIYQWDVKFRFSTMVSCTYTVAVVCLYYLACTFLFLYLSRTTGHLTFIRSYIEFFTDDELKKSSSFQREIILTAVITVIFYGYHLFDGLKNFKEHKSEIRTGKFVKIPRIEERDWKQIASKSVRYPGYLVGHTAWSFIICFHVVLFVLIGIRILSLPIQHVHTGRAIMVPLVVIYLLKTASFLLAVEICLPTDLGQQSRTGDLVRYAMFSYFIFVADWFIGVVLCVTRLAKATLLNCIHMARVDYSFIGRPSERSDFIYDAYIAYLYMEGKHSLVNIGFIGILCNSINKRPRRYYDENNFTPTRRPHKGRSEGHSAIDRTQNSRNLPSNNNRQTNTKDESTPKNLIHSLREFHPKAKSNTSLHPQENDSLLPLLHKNNSITDQYNKTTHSMDHTIIEIMPQTNSQNPVKTSGKNNSTRTEKKPDQQKPTQQVSQSSKPSIRPTPQSEDDTSDANGSRNPKRKQKDESKKKKKAIAEQDFDDEDDDRELKQKPTIKEIKGKKKSLFTQCFHNATEDEVNSFTKQNLLPVEKKKQALEPKKNLSQQTSSEESEDDGPSRHESITIGKIVPKVSNNTGSTKVKKNSRTDHGTAVRGEQKRAIRTATEDSAPSARTQKTPPITRTISYTEAQKNQLEPNNSSSSSSLSKTDHSTNYSEPKISKVQTGFINRLCGMVKSIQFLSTPSSEQASVPISTDRKSKEDIKIQVKKQLEGIKRKKIARNRWFLAYTLIHNPHLFDLTKNVINRLFVVRWQQISEINEQPCPVPGRAPLTNTRVADRTTRCVQDSALIHKKRSAVNRQYPRKSDNMGRDVETISRKPQSLTPIIENYSQSAVERYISNRCRMIYEKAEQETERSDPSISQTSRSRSSEQRNTTLPLFRLIPISDQRAVESPYPQTPSTTTFSKIRVDLTHDQLMSAYYTSEVQKIHKNRSNVYVYGSPTSPSTLSKLTTTVLTPMAVVSSTHNNKGPRAATETPFYYPAPPTATTNDDQPPKKTALNA